MAYSLTDRAKTLSSQPQIEPNLILAIDGYPLKFGAEIINVNAYVGQSGLEIGNFFIGGTFEDEFSRDYISLQGTSDTISQQLEPDKGGASSTQSIKIRLVDFNQEITQLISPGFDLDDILYRDAQVYLGFVGGAFPQDCIELFNGKIQSISAQSGNIELTIAHPEDINRAEIFTKVESKLVQDAAFKSAEIQDLTYFQKGDFPGTAQVRYLSNPFTGDVAIVTVSGNLISVQIDLAATKASTIKREVENDEFANQMVTVKVTGTGSTIQAAQAITNLDTATELFIEDATLFLEPIGTMFRTYVRINDEIISYTGVDYVLNKLTGVTRAQLNTIGAFHESDDDVSSIYRLGDGTSTSNAIDISLQVMLSGADQYYIDRTFDADFYNFGTVDNYPTGVLFRGIDLVRSFGVVTGDTLTTTGAANGANNITDLVIDDIEVNDFGTLVLVTGASFVLENIVTITAKFSSQYNTLPDGVGLTPNQVDIERFRLIKSRFGSSIANYDLYLKDTVTAKSFINEQLYLPSALYTVPRKGKVSVGFTSPPIYENDSKVLDISTVQNPSKLKIDRSTSKSFYNAIVYRYNEDSIEDKPLNGRVILSNDSINRIKSPNKPYTIFAKGVRPSAATTQLIERNARSLLSRYQFAAEQINVEPDFRTGYSIEVGDTVVFGGEELKVSDTKDGSRNFNPRIFEVINKSLNWKTGDIKLTLVDTNYSTGVRYGVWAPSSKVVSGTTTSITIQDSFGVDTQEKDKWSLYIGKKVRVHSLDYSYDEVTTLTGFDPGNDYKMFVDPALPSAPLSGYRVSVPRYEDLTGLTQEIYKTVNVFLDYTLTVVTGISTTQFTVSAPDAARLYVGSLVRIHNADYTIDSGITGIRVASIAGVTVTLEDPISFTPAAGQLVELVGFVEDEGDPYVWA